LEKSNRVNSNCYAFVLQTGFTFAETRFMNRIITILCLLNVSYMFAQQTGAAVQSWNVNLSSNPALAGLNYRHEANLFYRTSWGRIAGNPATGYANYAARIKSIHGGAGVSYVCDRFGNSSQNDILAHYAFHLPLGNNVLSVGVSGGANIYLGDWDKLTYPDCDPSETRPGRDPQFKMNAGIAWHAPKWNAGFSITQLNEPKFASYSATRHYWLFADYRFDLTDKCSLKPQIQFYTDAVNYNGNVSVMAALHNFWAAPVYNFNNGAGFAIGYNLFGKYRIGYNLQMYQSKLNNGGQDAMQEFTLGFLLN